MRRSWLVLLVVVLCAAFAANRTLLWAQEPGGAAEGPAEVRRDTVDEGVERESVLGVIWKYSGVPGWAIMFMSVVALYLIIRFVYQLRRDSVLPEGLLGELEHDLDNGRVRDAIEKCQGNESVLAHIVESALGEMKDGHEGMTTALEEMGEAENMRLQQQVGWLAIIGAIAPMLGLTGTVLGMMGAFSVIAGSETTPPPRELARHIQHALVTTCEGLLVAVPVLLAYAALRNRVTALMLEVGIVASGLIGRFKRMEITPAMLAGVEEALAGGPAAEAPPQAPQAEEAQQEVEEVEGGEEPEEEAPPPPPPPA